MSISLDGSGFDSTQFSTIMEHVDDKFWKLAVPTIEKSYQKSQKYYRHLKLDSVLFGQRFYAAATKK